MVKCALVDVGRQNRPIRYLKRPTHHSEGITMTKPVTTTPDPDDPQTLSVGGHGGRGAYEKHEVRRFAERLHQLMIEKGLSQSELARAVWGETKDSRGYSVARNRDRISAWLRGETVPEAANLSRLAQALDTPVTELAPDLTISAVERTLPAVAMTMVGGHSDLTLLQVHQLVPLEVAARIITLLSETAKAQRHAAERPARAVRTVRPRAVEEPTADPKGSGGADAVLNE